MCVIIHKPEGAAIPEDYVWAAADANPDGIGVMWNGVSGPESIRTFDPSESLSCLEMLADRECMLHFRLATHGGVDLDNCHPFVLSSGAMLAHNGILPVEIDRKERSDTWHFAQLLDETGFTEKLGSSEHRRQIERLIGPANKLGIVLPCGRFIRLGSWEELDGCWYTNFRWIDYLPLGPCDQPEHQSYDDWLWDMDRERDEELDRACGLHRWGRQLSRRYR